MLREPSDVAIVVVHELDDHATIVAPVAMVRTG
jgi:hypothetical protein